MTTDTINAKLREAIDEAYAQSPYIGRRGTGDDQTLDRLARWIDESLDLAEMDEYDLAVNVVAGVMFGATGLSIDETAALADDALRRVATAQAAADDEEDV